MEERYGKYLKRGGVFLPPWGLALLAAILRKERYDVMILDCEVLRLDYDQSCKEIFKFNPSIVGFTAATVSVHNAAMLASKIKKVNKNIPLIVGGVHVSGVPVETMKYFKDFDIGVIGEGEETIVELVKNIKDKSQYKNIKGIVYRDNGEIIINEPRPYIKELDSLPFPAFDLLPDIGKHYKPSPIYFKKLPHAMVLSSRGCFGKCTFCDKTVSGHKMRFHSADYIVDLILELNKKYGIRDLIFHDDVFIVNRKRLYKFCELFKKKNIKVVWQANARIDSVNLEVLKTIKESNCWLIAYGIESGSQKILNMANKRIKLEQIKQTLEWTKMAGLETKGYFILGLIGETKETLKETENFIMDIPLDILALNLFTPFPNTIDYFRAPKYGSFNNDWRLLNQHNVVFIPNGLTAKELEETCKRIQTKFYFRLRVVFYFIKKLFNYQKALIIINGFFTLLLYIIRRFKDN